MTESFLMPPIVNGVNKYAAVDNKYTISARTVTIKRFGPSGSLKKKNSIRELIMAVTANIISEIFFDLKYRFAVLLSITVS